MGGHRDVEAGRPEPADHRVVVAQVRRTGMSPRLHQPDRPAMARAARRGLRSPAAAWPSSSRSRLGAADLAEDDVDHRVDEVVLVREVAVEGHGRDAEHLRQRAHGEGVEPVRIGVAIAAAAAPGPAQRRGRPLLARWAACSSGSVSGRHLAGRGYVYTDRL